MERVLSQDERIRRAEEIYERRKMLIQNRKSATVNVDNKSENKLIRKLLLQIIICIIIYCRLLYCQKHSKFSFTGHYVQDIRYIRI